MVDEGRNPGMIDASEHEELGMGFASGWIGFDSQHERFAPPPSLGDQEVVPAAQNSLELIIGG